MKRKLLILTFLTLCVSCSKDSVQDDHRFTGSWVAYFGLEGSNTSAHRFDFKADGTYEEASLELDSETLEVLGYWTYATGTYSAIDNRLTLNRKEFYVSEDLSEYQQQEDLIKKEEIISYGFNYEFQSGSQFTLYPECPEDSSCLGAVEYEKLDE